MYKLALFFSMLLTLNANANSDKSSDICSECPNENFEECTLSKILFTNNDLNEANNLDISTIEIVEIEEEVEINFDTKRYLPIGFNALKGKDDINWNTIEVVEIQEDVEINFDTKLYLPRGFDALNGKDNFAWQKIALVLIEIEEELGYKLNKKTLCSL